MTGAASRFVLGVIGHVDHGKTTLVRALTGMETDRLAEEKRRGISIALGFAHLALPGVTLDLIDMPGHERFVRTLVAGATGIDAVLLVVAATEGIKPQTVEHLEIASLLGLGRIVIAVSKADLVPAEQASRMGRQAARLAAELGLSGPPPIAVQVTDAATVGLDALRQALLMLADGIAARPDRQAAFLPIDRVFSVAGHGTVITGTLRGGSLAVGQTLVLWPAGTEVRVRGLQVHRDTVTTAPPGGRTAVNLRGVDIETVRPGHALAAPGVVRPGRRLSVALRATPSTGPLRSGSRWRLLLGTSEVDATLRLLDRAELPPGETALAQLHCARNVAVPVREPVILRQVSPPRTVAGGRVLEADARRHRRHDPAVLARLAALAELPPEAIVPREVEASGPAGTTLRRLSALSGLGSPLVAGVLQDRRFQVSRGGTVVTAEALARVAARIETVLAGLPDLEFLPLARLAAALPEVGGAVLEMAIDRLAAAGRLRQANGAVRARREQREARQAADIAARAALLAEAIRVGGLTPPDPATLLADAEARRALGWLLRAGIVVRATDHVHQREVLFHRESIAAARRRLTPLLAERGLRVTEIGAALGVSRKYSVPLLEYFDAVQFTRRIDDRRVLRG